MSIPIIQQLLGITPDGLNAWLDANSVRFQKYNDAHLERTAAWSSSPDRRNYTISFWVKRTEFGEQNFVLSVGPNSTNKVQIAFESSDLLGIESKWSSSTPFNFQTNHKFRDTGWYHIFYSVSTQRSSTSDYVKLWVNGVEESDWASTNTQTQGVSGLFDTTWEHNIGKRTYQDSSGFEGYLAQMYLINNSTTAVTDVGEFDSETGVWKPKLYEGTFTRGLYLPLDGKTKIGEDQSGMGNHFTPRGGLGGIAPVNATGGLPILEDYSVGGGGVRKDDFILDGSSNAIVKASGCVFFDGDNDVLTTSAKLPTSTGTAFVVDCLWYSKGNSNQRGIWEQHSLGSGRTAYFVNGGSAYLISEGNTVGTFSYSDNTWYHTRIIFDGSGGIGHYVNGSLIASGTQTVGIDNTDFQIGAYSSDNFNGFVSNFRIVVGANSLSGTETITAPLTNITNTVLLCCQSAVHADHCDVGSVTKSGVDSAGSQVFACTGENWDDLFFAAPLEGHPHRDLAAYIRGGGPTIATDDNGGQWRRDFPNWYNQSRYGGNNNTDSNHNYIRSTNSLYWVPNNDDWTVEGWWYCIDNNNGGFHNRLWAIGDDLYSNCISMEYSNDAVLRFRYNDVSQCSGYFRQSDGSAILNEWVHVAVVRHNNGLTIYANGENIASSGFSTSLSYKGGNERLYIGEAPAAGGNSNNYGSSSWYGYFQDFRMYNRAKYTSEFTVAHADPDVQASFPVASTKAVDPSNSGSWHCDGSNTTQQIYGDFKTDDNDFSIECWIYPIGDTLAHLFQTENITTGALIAQLGFRDVNSEDCRFLLRADNGTNLVDLVAPAGTCPVEEWHHIVGTVDASEKRSRLFVDGKLVKTGTYSGTRTGTGQLSYMGALGVGSRHFDGHLSNCRLEVGAIPSEYQTTSICEGEIIFTPPTEPLKKTSYTKLLGCQSNEYPEAITYSPTAGGFSNSDLNKCALSTNGGVTAGSDAPTGFAGSCDFNNANDRIDISNKGGNRFLFPEGSSYTVEMWVKHDDLSGQQTYWGDEWGNNAGMYFCKQGNNCLGMYYSYWVVQGSTPLEANTWHHVAAVRDGHLLTLYVDGKQSGTAVDTANLTSITYAIGDTLAPGGGSQSSGQMKGRISNLRVVKGRALYRGNFTPPTEPLTAVQQTVLLCCQSSSSATQSADVPSWSHAYQGSSNQKGRACLSSPFRTDNVDKINPGHYAVGSDLRTDGGTWRKGGLEYETKNSDARIGMPDTTVTNGRKTYAEISILSKASDWMQVGVFGQPDTWTPGRLHWRNDGNVYNEGSNVGTIASWGVGDVLGLAYDDTFYDKKILRMYKNGQYVGYIELSSSVEPSNIPLYFGAASDSSGNTWKSRWNYGQQPWRYAPPEGYSGLDRSEQKDLVRTSRGMQYTGSGSGVNANSVNVGFKPDFVIIKNTNDQTQWHFQNAVQGTGLFHEQLNNQIQLTGGGDLSSFTDTGFNLSYTNNRTNDGGDKYIAFAWKAGGNPSLTNCGSIFFNGSGGSGGYLSIPDSNDWDIGTGDYTVECWYFPQALNSGGWDGLFGQWKNGNWNATNSWVLEMVSQHLRFYYCRADGTNIEYAEGPNNITVMNQWYHVAAVKNGGTIRVFINGTAGSDHTVHSSGINNGNGTFSIGGDVATSSGGGFANGHISNVKVTKGQALYWSNFTPTSSALTTTSQGSTASNVKLLCCQDGTNPTASAVTPGTITSNGALGARENVIPFTQISIDGTNYATAAAAGLRYGNNPVAGASISRERGFSIIRYRGANGNNNYTVDHGLLKPPNFIITKNARTFNYDIYHSSAGAGKYYILTDANSRSSGFNGDPNQHVINLQYNYSTYPGDEYIAYCWHNVSGVQHFGMYYGNGDSNGPYIGVGFKPAVLWIKRLDNSGDWWTYDGERDGYTNNPVAAFGNWRLRLNHNDGGSSAASGGSDGGVDILGNGFKIRNQYSGQNTNDGKYFYCAWADTAGLYGLAR